MVERIDTYYHDVLRRIDAVRRTASRVELATGLQISFLAFVACLLGAVGLERLLLPGIQGRTLIVIAVTLGMASVLGWAVARPLLRMAGILRRSTDEDVADAIGKQFPGVRDRLQDGLEMVRDREALRGHYSVDLIDAFFADLYHAIEGVDLTTAIDGRPVRRTRSWAVGALALGLLAFALSPGGFSDALARLIHFRQPFEVAPPLVLIVEPGDAETVRGQTVPISVRVTGASPLSLEVAYRQAGQLEFETRPLAPDREGVFRTQIEAIKLTTEYFASAGDVQSPRYTIKVLDRPFVRNLRVTLTPPAYTRTPPRTLEDNAGDINAYAGTRASFLITASKPLRIASILFGDSTTLELDIRDQNITGSYIVARNGSYHIRLQDSDGLLNADPVDYAIRVIPDESPTAELLSPAHNTDLTGEALLPLFIRFKDDFGFTRARLGYKLIQSRYEKPAEEFSYTDIPLPRRDLPSVDLWYRWDLSDLHLVPEDAVAYFAEVFDNDAVNGPKSGRSATFIVRLPSLEEVLADVSQSHQQSLESVQSAAKEAQQLQREVEELRRESKKSRNKMDWQERRKAEDLLGRYEAMRKKLEETSEKLGEMVKKMDENKLLSPQTMEKYQELQKLMEQLNSPELREALRKLQEAMKQMNPDQMQQAMDRLKLSEEQFRQNLERTIELLKRIHIEQKLDELVKRAEDIIRTQDEIRRTAGETQPSNRQQLERLAAEQRDLQKRVDSLQKETGQLREKMEEFPKEMPTAEMAQAEKQMKESGIRNSMQSSAQAMQDGNPSQAQQDQQQAGQEMQQFLDQLTAAQRALRDKQMKQIVQQLRKQLENVLDLSQRQEALKDETRALEMNSQRFREGAQKQGELLNDLSSVADALAQLGKKTFAVSPDMGRELGNALRQMADGLQGMEDRNPRGASDRQAESMGSLNRAAMLMQGALNGLMKGGKGGMGMAGLMAQLQQMAGSQSALNAATQAAMGQGEGQAMNPQQQADYQRLAGQQGSIRKSLEELAQEAKSSGDFSKLLGDLDRVAEEMREVQTDLEQGNVNPATTEKQERIVSRLLESTRSLRERDYEKRRRAQAGATPPQGSPPDIDLSTQEGRDALRRELLRVLEGAYAKDYEELIRRYFELLEQDRNSLGVPR